MAVVLTERQHNEHVIIFSLCNQRQNNLCRLPAEWQMPGVDREESEFDKQMCLLRKMDARSLHARTQTHAHWPLY